MQNPHETLIKVRGYHLDLYQHVNNARYLEFFEEARWRFFDELGISDKISQGQLAFIIVNMNIDFRHEAKMNDELIIKSHISFVRKSKMIVEQCIYLKDTQQLITKASIHFVLVDQVDHRIVSIQPHFNLVAAVDPL